VVTQLQIVDLGNFGLAGTQGEGTIERPDTAGEENIEVDIGHRVAQRTEVVEDTTVGKLPQVVYTVLERKIHNPHLVFRQMWLVEEEKEKHSVGTFVRTMQESERGWSLQMR
jgi:hypothetical protein